MKKVALSSVAGASESNAAAGRADASRLPPLSASPELPALPDYWQEACKHLVKKDRVMKRLIPQFPNTALQCRGDAFSTLARSIVGQQISVKAAQTVWHRFEALAKTTKADRPPPGRKATVGGIESREAKNVGAHILPANVLKLKVDDMRAAGLSARKVEYLVDLSIHFDTGTVHVTDWQAMEDEAIIAELIAIRGIGRWTAEMFLMFYLRRPNVLPLDDVGLINGIAKNYFSGEAVSRSDAREVAAAWAPYCSVATWYIWRSLDTIPVTKE